MRWSLPLPAEMIPLNSTDGAMLMKSRETLSVSFWNGFLHLETQKTQTFCSIATSVTILNSLASGVAPIDPIYDPYPYWTQDNFFNECTNNVIDPDTIYAIGTTLDQLGRMLSCYSVEVETVKANESSVDLFRSTVQEAMLKGDHIAINFNRSGLLESGGGHFSPLMAYNGDKDMVLITGAKLLACVAPSA